MLVETPKPRKSTIGAGSKLSSIPLAAKLHPKTENMTMLVYKRWVEKADRGATTWMREGYFLFGVIPLMLRDVSTRIKFHDTRTT